MEEKQPYEKSWNQKTKINLKAHDCERQGKSGIQVVKVIIEARSF